MAECRTAGTKHSSAPPPPPAQPDPAQQAHNQQNLHNTMHTKDNIVININWSHFKPEFSGKPEEDAEAHLLQN